VLGAVVVPGVGLALSSLGFGAITAFIALLFAVRGWSSAWLAFSAFAAAFIFARVVFGHLPDRLGGAKVALFSILIEAAGQAMIWLASGSAMAFAGALLTGFGYALVYPGFGIEAVRRTRPENRGLAMGTYTAFLDLALAIASPALGLVASGADLGAVFLVSAIVILCAAAIAWRLIRTPMRAT
jgi:MFS family permease